MSFAKFAAEALVNEDAEADRDEQKGRWKKWLATIAGLGALGAAGYYGYKNWPQSDHGKGLFERLTGESPAGAGALLGGFGSFLSGPLGTKMPWHNSAQGESLTGLRASSQAGGESQLDKAIAADNASMPGNSGKPDVGHVDPTGVSTTTAPRGNSLHSQLAEAMSPTTGAAHPLSLARHFGDNPQPLAGNSGSTFAKFRDYFRSGTDLQKTIEGLRSAHTFDPNEAAASQSLPAAVAGDSGGSRGVPVAAPVDPRAEQVAKIRAGIQARFGINPSQLADRIESYGRMRSTTLGKVMHPIGNAIAGAVIGSGVQNGVDWLTGR